MLGTSWGFRYVIPSWRYRLLLIRCAAHLPENTLASYRAAILEGAEGIESGTSTSPECMIYRAD